MVPFYSPDFKDTTCTTNFSIFCCYQCIISPFPYPTNIVQIKDVCYSMLSVVQVFSIIFKAVNITVTLFLLQSG